MTKRLLLIGIGAGDPEHVTVQAVRAMNEVDVFFVLDKGGDRSELAAPGPTSSPGTSRTQRRVSSRSPTPSATARARGTTPRSPNGTTGAPRSTSVSSTTSSTTTAAAGSWSGATPRSTTARCA